MARDGTTLSPTDRESTPAALRADTRRTPPRVFSLRFDLVGLTVGAFFGALSLLPSLLPRIPFVQGIASGVTFMVGYGAGASGFALWRYLGLPTLARRRHLVAAAVAALVACLTLASAIWQFIGWQNEIRRSFGMSDLTPDVWPIVVGVSLATSAVILIASRALRSLFRLAGNWLDRYLPRRLAITLATTALVLLLWLLVSGLLVRGLFAAANASFSGADRGDKAGVIQPLDPSRSGSSASSVAWEDMGRQGRAFVSDGPTVDELNSFSGGGAVEPVRVYVGLRSADTLQARADLLLEELKRTHAFDRQVLVIATTTGTGWLDARGVDPVEYLWNGDTAIAGVQYSYLPSWLSLLADQDAVKLTSATVFRTVYDYWSQLPDDSRPRLYLYGLSLGSYGVEAVLGNIDILNEPIDGALMVGPPFINPVHSTLEAARQDGTSPWHPVVSGGRTVRFATEDGGLDEPAGPWGPTRVIYLQHGSDPVVFFDPSLAWSKPAWLQDGQRAPDVSNRMTWVPLVTMWQTLLDLPAAESVPDGYGHVYSVRANLQCWVALTEPEEWSDAKTNQLVELIERLDAEHRTFIEQFGD